MESFPEQLKRQGHYYSLLYKTALQYLKAVTHLVELEQTLAGQLHDFCGTEAAYSRGPLAAFAELLLQVSGSQAGSLANLESFLMSFDCQEDISDMKRLVKEQRAQPCKEINQIFVQNAAVYQQNRLRSAANAMRGLSQTYMQQAAALLQAGSNLRFQADAIDDLAPVIDVARRCVHLDLPKPTWQILNLDKDVYEHADITGRAPRNVVLYRRGIQRPKSTKKDSKKKSDRSSSRAKNILKQVVEEATKSPQLQGFQQQQFQQLTQEPPLQYDSPKPQQLYMFQQPEQTSQPQLYQKPVGIQNQLLGSGKLLPNTQEAMKFHQSTRDPQETLIPPKPQEKQKKQYNFKKYNFEDSLFEESSDKPQSFMQGEIQLDDDEVLVKAQISSQRAKDRAQVTAELGDVLKRQMEETEAMLKELTQGPTSLTNRNQTNEASESKSVPTQHKLNPIVKSDAPKSLKPLEQSAYDRQLERNKKNVEFQNELIRAMQEAK